MTTRDKIIEKQENLINDLINMIRIWHGMGMPTEQEKRMWQIFFTSSPEMKRVNEIIVELSVLKSQLSKEPEIKETFCSLCKYYNDLMRKAGIQSKCNNFKEVCAEVNNGGHCNSFEKKEPEMYPEEFVRWTITDLIKIKGYWRHMHETGMTVAELYNHWKDNIKNK